MTPRWGRAVVPTAPTLPGAAPRSLERRARRLVRSLPRAQGVVIAFSGAADDVVDVTVLEGAPRQLRGRRDGPQLVVVENLSPWTVRSVLRGAPGAAAVVETIVTAPRPGRVELLRLRADGGRLTCAVSTVRFSAH